MSFRSITTLLLTMAFGSVYAQEICANGMDDDADGLVDLNDPSDCSCTGISGSTSHLSDPSFEEVNCIPTGEYEWDCSPFWSNGTGPTTDLLHVNGFYGNSIPQPLPGGGLVCAGAAITQDYREYLGTCLATPLQAGATYSMTFHMSAFLTNGNGLLPIGPMPPISITVFGSTDCPTWPTLADCPGNLPGWFPIGSVEYTPAGVWSPLELTLEPLQEVNAIQIGAPCGQIPGEYSFGTMLLMFPYLLYDHFSLIGSQPVVLDSIQASGSWCSDDLVLSVDPPMIGQTSQWFYEGVAIPGAIGTSLDISASGSSAGEYQFVCWSAEECDLETITLEPVDLPDIEPEVTVDQCAPATIQLSLPGIPANAVATWTISDGEIIAGAEASHVLQYPGTYSITVDILYENGCSMTEVISDIVIRSGPIAAFDHSVVVDVVGNTMLYTSDVSIGDIVEWEWHLDQGTTVEGLSGPYATFDLGADPVPGSLTMIVTDIQGCMDTITYAIQWQLPSGIHVPNSFTPNNDGMNDEWRPMIVGNAGVLNEVCIYDRWGSPIWSTSDPNDHWDGTIYGNACPPGIYPWVISMNENASGEKRLLQGHISLIR